MSAERMDAMETTKSARPGVAARATLLILGLLVLVATLTACGGSSSSSSSSGASSSGQGARPSGNSSSDGDMVQSSGSSASRASGASGAGGVGGSGEAAVAAPEDQEQGDSGSGGDASDFDRKVVKTADLGLRARDVRETSREAQRLASSSGGSVLSSRIRRGEGDVSARLVLLVPAPEFESTLDELRALGEEVTTDSVKGQDVTEEFVDLQSRERNLLAAEESLLRLFDEAESVEDSLSVQSELTEVRGEIEQVQGRIEYLEQRTNSARISLDIQPAVGSAPLASAWKPTATAAQAWNASLGVLQALATAVISTIVFSWWLAPVAVAVLGGFIWWRRRNLDSGSGASDSSQT